MKRVEALGGLCEKFVSPGRRGVPDRIVTWPCGYMELVELKSPTGTVKPWQTRDHQKRKNRGVDVYILASYEDVNRYVDAMHAILRKKGAVRHSESVH